jgi:hypothetical protein
MPIELVVNNISYEYPISGDSPGWGQAATDWATEVTFVLNNLKGPNDILQTSFSSPAFANNQVTPADIVGLSFNTGQVRAAFIQYSIYRTSTANPSGNAEAGMLIAVYDNLAGSGSKWSLTAGPISGNSGVTFSMTDAGQLQYTSSDIGATGYSAVMKFSAKALNQ